MSLILTLASLGATGVLLLLYILSLRRIVPTNEVHIVQRNSSTVSYGKDTPNGNVYYQIPTWVPKLGIVVSKLPTTIIPIDIPDYEAYDIAKLKFKVDIKAFFRITDFGIAASRIFSVKELTAQLENIVQGAARSILANEQLETIMIERTKYGDMFTDAVSSQLKEWGVAPVKNIELMDIKDSQGEGIIENIMKKKKSQVEMESRIEVAQNLQKAQEAEIAAKQEIELRQQEAEKKVGLRQAQVQQEVGIANEKQQQEVQAEAKVTAEKQMEVKRVKEVQNAEIEKQAAEVKANQDKEVTRVNAEASVIKAEADKKVQVVTAEAQKEQVELQAQATKTQIELKADADLKTATNEAKGIKLKGESEANARELMEKAQVAGQIELKEKVTGDTAYQDFMIKQAKVEAEKAIGVEQAKNLSGAEIKIFANAGTVAEGVTSAGKILSTQTGLDIASAIEGLAATEIGKNIVEKFTKKKEVKD